MTEQRRDFGPPSRDLKDRPSRARYEKVRAGLELKSRRRTPKADRLMVEVVEALWDDFSDNPYSGCGFHILSEDASTAAPGHRRGKLPELSLDAAGVVGRAVAGRCSARASDAGLSRIAVPVFDSEDRLWAVLEAASAKPDAFDDMDARWLERIVKVFRLTQRVGGG
ncbi:MAG: hypothetical protein HY924_16200 [Elusimicrobia bacterium]|nr:hypothetical protein [Elusimicrobiota bacterium]